MKRLLILSVLVLSTGCSMEASLESLTDVVDSFLDPAKTTGLVSGSTQTGTATCASGPCDGTIYHKVPWATTCPELSKALRTIAIKSIAPSKAPSFRNSSNSKTSATQDLRQDIPRPEGGHLSFKMTHPISPIDKPRKGFLMMMLFTLLLGFTLKSYAQDISVVDVRRNITMSETDTIYKDFYLSAGPSSGLKKNLVVTAVRKVNIRDASGANAVGEILVPVGQLKVIAVYDRVAVAREFNLLSRDELPMLEQIGIMSGDRIDLKGSFIDTSKPKKRKVSEAESNSPVLGIAIGMPAPTARTTPGEAVEEIDAPAHLLPQSPVVSANVAAEKIMAPASPKAATPTAETLEKTADSGNTSLHE